MKKQKFYGLKRFTPFILFTVLCLGLIILHGYKMFVVDSITVALLVLIAIPVIGQFVESVSISGNEIKFKELNQIVRFFIFLESMSEDRRWTFYPSRPGESNIGEGLGILVSELLSNSREKTIHKLSEWLKAKNDNTRWFASEIIGFFKIEELKRELVKYFQPMVKDQSWEYWKLNCLWAYSRFNNYKEMGEFLNDTTDHNNQVWLIEAIKQMVETENNKNLFESALERFAAREDVPPNLKNKALSLLDK